LGTTTPTGTRRDVWCDGRRDSESFCGCIVRLKLWASSLTSSPAKPRQLRLFWYFLASPVRISSQDAGAIFSSMSCAHNAAALPSESRDAWTLRASGGPAHSARGRAAPVQHLNPGCSVARRVRRRRRVARHGPCYLRARLMTRLSPPTGLPRALHSAAASTAKQALPRRASAPGPRLFHCMPLTGSRNS